VAQTVLIVDDHAGFRASARSLLESDGFRVVGEAATGAEALAFADEFQPAVVLLDVQLPDLDGFEVAERLRAMENPPEVILTSTRDSGDFGPLIAAAPARGFVGKGELTADAIRALLSALRPRHASSDPSAEG
jgi:DNA-binding NarL/FixJ family response regulator